MRVRKGMEPGSGHRGCLASNSSMLGGDSKPEAENVSVQSQLVTFSPFRTIWSLLQGFGSAVVSGKTLHV